MNKDLQVRLKFSSDTVALTQAKKEVKDLSISLTKGEQASQGFSVSYGKMLGVVGGTGAIVAGATMALSEIKSGFEKLEDLELDIAKTTGLNKEDLAEVVGELDKMSVSLAGFEVSGLYQIAEASGQVGVRKDDLAEYAREMQYFASTSTVAGDEAASGMAKIANAVNLDFSDINHLTAAITTMASNTAATEEVLMDSMQRIAGAGHTALGLANADMVALGATMEDVGINVEVGGTAISDMFLKMISDTDKFAKASGVSLDEYKKIIEEKPIKAIEMFLESLGKMNKEAKVDTLKELGLNAGGSTRTLLTLSTSTEKLTENLKLANDAYREGTATQQEYLVKSESLTQQEQKKTSAILLLEKSLGEKLKPTMIAVNDITVDSIEWVKKHDEEIASVTRSIVVATGAYLTITGAIRAYNAVMAINTTMGVVKNLSALDRVLVTVTGAYTSGAKAVGLFNMVLGKAPWAIAITGALGLAVALDKMWESESRRAKLFEETKERIATGDAVFNKDGFVIEADKQSLKEYNTSLKEYEQNLKAVADIKKILKKDDLTTVAKSALEKNLVFLSSQTGKLKDQLDYAKDAAEFEGNSFEKTANQGKKLTKSHEEIKKSSTGVIEKLKELKDASNKPTIISPATPSIPKTNDVDLISQATRQLEEQQRRREGFEREYDRTILDRYELEKKEIEKQKEYYQSSKIDQLKIDEWYSSKMDKLDKEQYDKQSHREEQAYQDYLGITGKKEKLFDLETEKILERFKNLGYSEEKLEEIEDARWANWAESGMDAIETVEEKSNEFTDGLYASLGSVFDVLLDGGDVFEALEGELDKMNKSNSSATSDNIMTGIQNGSFDGIFTDSNGEMTTGGYQAMATAGHLFAQSAFGDSENVQRGEQFGQAAGTAIGSIWGPAGAIVGGMIGEIAGGAIGSLLGGEHSTRYDVNEDGTITEVDHKSGGLFSHSSNSDVGDATARLKTIEYSLEHYLEIFDVFDKDLALSVGTHKRVIDEYNTMFFNSLAGVSDEYLNQEYVSRNSFNKYWRDSISDEEWDKIEAGNEIKKAWERYADAKDEEVNEVLAEVFGNLEQTENAIFEFVNRDDVDAIYRDRIAKGEQYERELEALYANGQDVTLENYREIRDGITDPDILNGYIALEQQLLSNAQVADEYADVLEDASAQVTSAYNDMIASLAQADHSRVVSIYGQIDQYEASIASYSDTLIQESQDAYQAQIDYAKKVTEETSKMYSTAVTSFKDEIKKLTGVGQTDEEQQFDQIVQFNQKQAELERLLTLDSVDQNQLNSVYGDLLNLSDSLGMDADLNGSIVDLLRGDIDLFGSTSTQAVVEYTESSAVASRNDAQYAEIQAQREQLELLQWMVEDDRSVYMTERGFVESFRDQEDLSRYQTRALYEISEDGKIESEELRSLEGILSDQQLEALWEQTNLERSNTDRIVDAINGISIQNNTVIDVSTTTYAQVADAYADASSSTYSEFSSLLQCPSGYVESGGKCVSSTYFDKIPSYAGGGYTGSGSRSGGVDGIGGYMAILHPNEIVSDLEMMKPISLQKSENSEEKLLQKILDKIEKSLSELKMIKKASVEQVNESREFRWSQENISALGGGSIGL